MKLNLSLRMASQDVLVETKSNAKKPTLLDYWMSTSNKSNSAKHDRENNANSKQMKSLANASTDSGENHIKQVKRKNRTKKSKKRKKTGSFLEVSELSSEDSDRESALVKTGLGEKSGKNDNPKEAVKELEVKSFSFEGMTRVTKPVYYDLDAVVPLPEELKIVRRHEWSGKPPKSVTNKSHITSTIMFTYSTDSKPCTTLEECSKTVRYLQKGHMCGGLPDIPYNFLVGGDGRIYEGRGWHAEPETDSSKYRQLKGHYVEFAFIGNYRVERPSDAMFDAALELIDYGRRNFWVKERFGLIENYD